MAVQNERFFVPPKLPCARLLFLLGLFSVAFKKERKPPFKKLIKGKKGKKTKGESGVLRVLAMGTVVIALLA